MFDIAQLQKNQRDYIASHLTRDGWECDVPKDVPLDLVDEQIALIFTHLNLYEDSELKLWSMKGPVDHIPLSLPPYAVVSRGAKATVDWFGPTFVADYTQNILRRIEDTRAILRRDYKNFVFYFGMWIPVYAAHAKTARCRAGIMLHFSQKVVKEEDRVTF